MNKNSPELANGIVEISLTDIFSFVRKYWLMILLGVLVSAGIGFATSFFKTPEYDSSAKILPEYGMGVSVGGLSDLASLAGISMGKNNFEAIRPDLYPSILSSKPFLIKLLSTPLPTSNGKKVQLVTYLNEEAEPFNSHQLDRGDTLISISMDQERSLLDAEERVTAAIDKLSGVLTITARMPDPVLAAACATFSMNYLTSFVSEYRGGRKAEKVSFLRQQVVEAKERYRRAEVVLNAYRDSNRNTYTNVARIEEQRLQNDYLQAQTLHGELARQLEAARLQALEETPVLQVLEPPMVPNFKSSPKRLAFVLGFGIFGGLFMVFLTLFGKEKVHQKFI